MAFPIAQSESLITRWIDGELIVIDTATHTVHCLRADAARVFIRCDGLTSPVQIAETEGLATETVSQALTELADAGLLADAVAGGLTRRQLSVKATRVAAVAAAATPLLYSALLPATAAAVSLRVCGEAFGETNATNGSYHMCGTGTNAEASSAGKAMSLANISCRQGRLGCSANAVCLGGNTGQSSLHGYWTYGGGTCYSSSK